MDSSAIALPGQSLGSASTHIPGPGTHLHNALICASIPGRPVLQAPATSSTPAHSSPSSTLSISRGPIALTTSTTNVLPTVDATVLARVTRIAARQATVAILAVGDRACAEEAQGLIRVQDVRATEKDKVQVAGSFRPGDVVRAVVISLGDQSNYYLSTASNMLGVVMATSEAGNAMYPVSWKEFRDPRTGALESRKVAKPF